MASKTKVEAPTEVPPVIITLTLPAEDAAPATMLIQRGDLAHIRQFPYEATGLAQAIQDAYIALTAVEAAPPVIPAAPEAPKPAPRPASTAAPSKSSKPAAPKEPVLKLMIGKTAKGYSHMQDVPERFIQGLDTDQRERWLPLIIKLIDGHLWDGKSPIRIEDAAVFEKKLKHLSAKELSLFSLTDFVQPGEDIPWVPPVELEPVIDEAEEPEPENTDDTEDVDDDASEVDE